MRVVDLFSGCGGMSKGFEKAGFDIVLAIENWEAARKVYEVNFDHPVINFDLINDKEASKFIIGEKPDMIIGGPPCQEFSLAGRRVEGERAELTISFAKIVKAAKPKWFVLENVQGIIKSNAWSNARVLLKEAGYGITETVLNAAYFGVPQKRRRFFAIGCLGETDNFLIDAIEKKITEHPLSVREFFGDEIDVDFYYRHPRNWGRRGIYSIDEAAPTVRSTNRQVSPGYTPHHDDAGCHLKARALTVIERARIQTFDKNFNFEGSDTALNLMIANAVPVRLAEHIATTILKYEKEQGEQETLEFRKWLAETKNYSAKTISDVVCRLKRVSKVLNIDSIYSDPIDIIHKLEKNQEYVGFSTNIKSQIKKAVRLQSEFHNNKNYTIPIFGNE